MSQARKAWITLGLAGLAALIAVVAIVASRSQNQASVEPGSSQAHLNSPSSPSVSSAETFPPTIESTRTREAPKRDASDDPAARPGESDAAPDNGKLKSLDRLSGGAVALLPGGRYDEQAAYRITFRPLGLATRSQPFKVFLRCQTIAPVVGGGTPLPLADKNVLAEASTEVVDILRTDSAFVGTVKLYETDGLYGIRLLSAREIAE